MRTARKTIGTIVMFFMVFGLGLPEALATLMLDDGGTHTLNFTLNDGVVVRNSPLGQPTTLNLVTGGWIQYTSYVYDSSQLNIFGGSINAHLSIYQSSQVSISGGSIHYDFRADDNSQVNISGGSIGGGSYAYGSSQVNISGGSMFGGLCAHDTSQVNFSGGSISGELHVFEDSQVNISGGSLGGNLLVLDTSQIIIYGKGFNYPYGTLTGWGLLTGTLASGDLINRYFQTYGDGQIVLISAPGSIVLGGIGVGFVGCLLRRRTI